MTKISLKLAASAALLVSLSAQAIADIKVNENLSVSGYAVGSYEYYKTKGNKAADSLFDANNGGSADAAKIQFDMNYKPVSGVLSFYYAPNTGANELSVLDVNVRYDVGGGVSVTAGKFLSYLGYEAFDPVNMAQITYSPVTVGELGAIPGYHSGVKVDYSDKEVGYGFALVDSVYNPFSIYHGDGELSKNVGIEGYLVYKGIADLTLWSGFAYDSKGNNNATSILTLDFWAQYQLTKSLQVAAEYCKKDGGQMSDGSTWLAFANYSLSDTVSIVGRVGGEELRKKTVGKDFIQYTVGPSLKLTPNLTVRGEVSFNDYKGETKGWDKTTVGVQVLFKF